MLVTQLLLADIVRRVTHDVRAVVLAVLMPEAALYYGLLMAKVSPDVAQIPFAVAMVWALVRLTRQRRCALVAGRGPVRGTGAAVEIHHHHAAPGRARLHAGAGLAPALAAEPVSLARGADRGRGVPAGADLERGSTTGRRSGFNSYAPPRPTNCRFAPSGILSACSSGWSASSCCPWCCRAS